MGCTEAGRARSPWFAADDRHHQLVDLLRGDLLPTAMCPHLRLPHSTRCGCNLLQYRPDWRRIKQRPVYCAGHGGGDLYWRVNGGVCPRARRAEDGRRFRPTFFRVRALRRRHWRTAQPEESSRFGDSRNHTPSDQEGDTDTSNCWFLRFPLSSVVIGEWQHLVIADCFVEAASTKCEERSDCSVLFWEEGCGLQVFTNPKSHDSICNRYYVRKLFAELVGGGCFENVFATLRGTKKQYNIDRIGLW